MKQRAKPRRRVRRKRRTRDGQLLMQFPLTWGGKRPGAGRKPTGRRAGVRHRPRPVPPVPDRGAVHISLRVVDGLPSLRRGRCRRAILVALAAANTRFGMRLVHFSIQRNHLHLIVEVHGREALIKAMRGLSTRIARQLNAALARKGRVLADRYHAEMLDSFARLRRTIAYVLNNARRHAYQHGGWLKIPSYVDPCSSGPYFDGWLDRAPLPWPRGQDPPQRPPEGYALREGWRRHGLVAVDEIPGAPAPYPAKRARRA